MRSWKYEGNFWRRTWKEEQVVWRERVVVGVVTDEVKVKVGLFFWKEGLALACRRTRPVVVMLGAQSCAGFRDKMCRV